VNRTGRGEVGQLPTGRRVGLFVEEVGLIVGGMIGSMAVASIVAVLLFAFLSLFIPQDSTFLIAAALIVWIGLLLACCTFTVVQINWATRRWRIPHDALRYSLQQEERRLHSTRSMPRRVIKRVLLGMPSVLAAFVFFFYPLVTHLVYPGALRVAGNRVQVPWTSTILAYDTDELDVVVGVGWKRKLGYRPFPVLRRHQWIGSLIEIRPNQWTTIPSKERAERAASGPIVRRDVEAAGATVVCWQYPRRYGEFMLNTGLKWGVECESSDGDRKPGFQASFIGPEEGLSVFYQMIEGIQPAQ